MAANLHHLEQDGDSDSDDPFFVHVRVFDALLDVRVWPSLPCSLLISNVIRKFISDSGGEEPNITALVRSATACMSFPRVLRRCCALRCCAVYSLTSPCLIYSRRGCPRCIHACISPPLTMAHCHRVCLGGK